MGRLYDFEQVDRPATEIRAPRAGFILTQPFRVPIKKGDTMLVIAQKVVD